MLRDQLVRLEVDAEARHQDDFVRLFDHWKLSLRALSEEERNQFRTDFKRLSAIAGKAQTDTSHVHVNLLQYGTG